MKINPKFFFHKKGHKTYELLARKWNLNEHVYLNWNPHLSTGTNQTKWEKSQKHEKWETKKAKKKRITVSVRKHAAKRKFTSSTPSTSLYLIQKSLSLISLSFKKSLSLISFIMGLINEWKVFLNDSVKVSQFTLLWVTF